VHDRPTEPGRTAAGRRGGDVGVNGNSARGSRFIFYANELIGLGQLRRTLALATDLAKADPGPSSLILSGSPVEPTFRLPPRVDTVKLPLRSRDLDGNLSSARLELSSDELRSLRSSIALAATTSFQPDVVVVDKLPLGQAGELEATLDALKAASDCRLVLGLRDIEDSPENVRHKWGPKMRAALARYYDAILVYGPGSSPDAIDCIGGFDLDVPIHHVGYVGASMPDRGPDDLEPGYLLATAGGGFDGFRLLATFAEAVRMRPLGCPAVMVTGPLMGGGERRRLMRLTDGLDIRCTELRTDMESVIAGSRAVVSMAGYNTVAEVMRAGKPAILVPRVRPSEEQLIRADVLATAGLQQMIHPAELSASRLRNAIDRLLRREAPRPRPDHYAGTERATRILARLGGLDSAPATAELETAAVRAG
jgi:predicted glycosyltransferase